MTVSQKNQKKKNIIIIAFMVLLLVFVALMCYIIIYAKKNPPREFTDPSEIEIVTTQMVDYNGPIRDTYTLVTESTNFTVTENNQELKLMLTDTKEVKVVRNEVEETIEIMQNNNNINNNIKLIYQSSKGSLILTEDGLLYKLLNNELTDGKIIVGQIVANMKVNSIVHLGVSTDSIYVLNDSNQLINIDNLKEYQGIINEIKTSTTTIYVYENYSFGTEEGKMFVTESGIPIEMDISFDNKVISKGGVIYEISSQGDSISTSSLGTYEQVGYRKQDDETYKVSLLSSTGAYDFVSTYYYKK